MCSDTSSRRHAAGAAGCSSVRLAAGRQERAPRSSRESDRAASAFPIATTTSTPTPRRRRCARAYQKHIANDLVARRHDAGGRRCRRRARDGARNRARRVALRRASSFATRTCAYNRMTARAAEDARARLRLARPLRNAEGVPDVARDQRHRAEVHRRGRTRCSARSRSPTGRRTSRGTSSTSLAPHAELRRSSTRTFAFSQLTSGAKEQLPR